PVRAAPERTARRRRPTLHRHHHDADARDQRDKRKQIEEVTLHRGASGSGPLIIPRMSHTAAVRPLPSPPPPGRVWSAPRRLPAPRPEELMASGNPNPPGDPNPPAPNAPGAYSQQISHSPVSARVPERVARGVLSTGVIVLDSPNEFVLDFLQSLSRPPAIVSRVVLPPQVMFSFVASLRDNLNKFSERFGAPQPLPKPPQQNRPSIQELYEHFKLPDDLLSGTYANSVLIGHSPSEFLFDFITGFYPTASVSSRVY